mgnify:CR=1 FL=1
MAISAKDVMELRKQTDCGMMECKKALTEADGNFEKAIEILRERGLATAAKKASRVAAEGMVYADYCPKCKVGVVIEVNAETDFVAKNDKFVDFVKEATKVVMLQNPADVEALMACKTEAGETVDEALKNLILVIKENIKIAVLFVTRAFALLTSTAAAPTASWSTSRPPTTSTARTSSLLTARTSPCRSQLLTPAMSMRLLSPLRSLPRKRRSCWLRWLAIPRTPTSLML